jgi:branched-chain amino acid transport system permease protein
MKKYKLPAYGVFVIMLFFVPLVVTNAYYMMLFNQVLVFIIAVLGLNFITGLTGQVNMGMAGIFSLGAYTSALLTTRLQISPWLGLAAAIFMGLLIGVALGWPSLRLKGIYLSLTTIGFAEIVRLVITNMAPLTGGARGVIGIPVYTFFGIRINTEARFYILVLAIVIVMVFIAVRIVNSKWGRAFKAVRDNEDALRTSGINIARIKIIAFVLSAIYGSVAGALYAHMMGFITAADFNFDFSVRLMMMLMLGGIGTVRGSILGGIVITLLPEYLRFLQDYYWLIFGVIILVMVVRFPHGLDYLVQKVFSKIARASRQKGGGGHVGNTEN